MSQFQWTYEEPAHSAEEAEEETIMGSGEPTQLTPTWIAPDARQNQTTPASDVGERDTGLEAKNAQWPR